MTQILLPEEKARRLAFYLAMEDFVAEHIAPGEEFFFLWQSPPTVIYGHNQDPQAEIRVDWCRAHGVDMVRRKSGGGAVYSDPGNLMISCISGSTSQKTVFDSFMDRICAALCALGLDAGKSGRNDVLVGGRKVSGTAFHLLPHASVVHGTLLYDLDMAAMEAALTPPAEKLARHGVPSVQSRVTNLRPLLESAGDGRIRSIEALRTYLATFLSGDDTASRMLSATEVAAIERIEAQDYITF